MPQTSKKERTQWAELCERATDEVVLIRYEHGGGRAFVAGPDCDS